MQTETHPMLDLAAWDAANGDTGLVIADGKTVALNVYDGMLVIKDGPMGAARERRFARVPRTVKHVVILSGHGYISIDAMRWLEDCEVTYAVIDRSGQSPSVLATSARYVNPINMRRQAMCGPGMPAAATGTKIFRHLLSVKLEGQARNAERILRDDVAAKAIRGQLDGLAVARDVTALMGYEGGAADAYWQAWAGMPIAWLRQPTKPHWLTFPMRKSLRRNWETNRGATDPVNALLNFAYKCAETECILACYACALSPDMGIGHVDRAGRSSFALDLIEVMRPECDAIVAGILAERLDKRMFREDREGCVSVCAPLTHRVAAEVHSARNAITKALFTVLPLLDSPQSRRVETKRAAIDANDLEVVAS